MLLVPAVLLALQVVWIISGTLYILFDTLDSWNIPKFLIVILKPIPIYVCIVMVAIIMRNHLRNRATLLPTLFLAGSLFVGSIGDIFLALPITLPNNDTAKLVFGILGIASFLVGHIGYVISFSWSENEEHKLQFDLLNTLKRFGFWILPYLLLVLLVLLLLVNTDTPTSPAVIAAVGIYMAVSVSFVWRLSVHVQQPVAPNDYLVGFQPRMLKLLRWFAAHLFIVSDSMIALRQKKVFPSVSDQVYGVAIMITYYAAQYLIAISVYEYAIAADYGHQEEEEQGLFRSSKLES